MNFESEIAGDPAVRKAIAMGIDKESFAGKLLGGNGYAAAGAFPGNFSFGGDVVSAEEYDPEEVKDSRWTHIETSYMHLVGGPGTG